MKKLSMLGFVCLALFLGLSLVAYPNSTAAEEEPAGLDADANLGADADLDAQWLSDIALEDRYFHTIYGITRGDMFYVKSMFTPNLRCYPCKIKNRAKFKADATTNWVHLTTQWINGGYINFARSAIACEQWAARGQRVKVQTIVAGGDRRTEYFYVY
jgi:hypothetical protein